MELSKIIEYQKRFSNRHHHPTCQPHPFLLAHQRRKICSTYRPVLCGESNFCIRLHLPKPCTKPSLAKGHHPHLNWHIINIRHPPYDDRHNRLYHRKGIPHYRHHIQLDRMPSHRISDRTYTPANHNPKEQMAYSFRQICSKRFFHLGIIKSAR